MIKLFFALVQAGMYERNFGTFPELSLKQWKALVALAHRQTVTGLLFRGITHLPKGYPLPQEILLRLGAEAEAIERQSRKVQQVADSLTARYQAEGLHPVIMKGPEVAKFYPHPLLRECGDLDLYFTPDEFGKATALSGEIRKAPDGSVHFRQEDVDIDLHRNYFDIHGRNLPEVSSPEALLLMLSGHILKHCMGVGIGLRQLCDVALAYKSLNVPPAV